MNMKMKILNTLVALVLVSTGALGQTNLGVRIKENAKYRTTNRIENRAGDAVERGLDKVEDGIRGAFNKKDKEKEKEESAIENREAKNAESNGGNQNSAVPGPSSDTPALSVYSKFDFVPGEKVILLEEFEKDEIGDFPVNWNTNGSGEVVRLSNKDGKWLKLSGEGIFYPETLGNLPENVTIEFEIGTTEANQVQTDLFFVDANNNLLNFGYENSVHIILSPIGGFQVYCKDKDNGVKFSNSKSQNQYLLPKRPFVKISIWKQDTRLRLYMNEEKIIDIPRAFEKGVNYRMVFFPKTYFQSERETYVGNLRVAAGKPDTRSKLISEGKLSTTGIKFDSGSDKIKPESYGTLQEIANVLKENPGVRIKIVGHTDSDGNATSNLELSKRRSASVKQFLVNEFGIQGDRMETDGKGQSEPVAPNTTPEGKANNRRVEFIKL
jgi:outer membrane protein OmpA-like peptidoglycan-associated protein